MIDENAIRTRYAAIKEALVQIFELSDAGQCSEYISCGEHGLPHFGGAFGMI